MVILYSFYEYNSSNFIFIFWSKMESAIKSILSTLLSAVPHNQEYPLKKFWQSLETENWADRQPFPAKTAWSDTLLPHAQVLFLLTHFDQPARQTLRGNIVRYRFRIFQSCLIHRLILLKNVPAACGIYGSASWHGGHIDPFLSNVQWHTD